MELEFKELPDRRDDSPLVTYGVKIGVRTWERIKLINAHKSGLTDQIREAIERVTQVHWDRLQSQLKDRRSDV